MSTGPRILLVEDEASIAEPFAKLLRREGFEASIARTAADALRAAREEEPDLVLLDLALPDGDGRDARATAASAPSAKRVIIVATRARAELMAFLLMGGPWRAR